MTNKQQIEQDAEREGQALRKQGQAENKRHLRIATEYNKAEFEKLFKN